MTIGRKKPKSAETAGGRTPEMNVNEPGEACCHSERNPTNDVSLKDRVISAYMKRNAKAWDTYRCQIGKNRDDEQRNCVEEADEAQENPARGSFARNLSRGGIEVLPYLKEPKSSASIQGRSCSP